MKNKLIDLNNHLFAQLEKLGDEDLAGEDLDREIKRTDAMVAVSSQIIQTANIALSAAKLVASQNGNYENMLPLVHGRENINDDLPALAEPKRP
jgi:hypothetical protein